MEVGKRNVPVARVVPIATADSNRTRLGTGRGTAVVMKDLTEPQIPEGDWNMLREDPPVSSRTVPVE